MCNCADAVDRLLMYTHTLRKEPFWLFKKTQRKYLRTPSEESFFGSLRRANKIALQEGHNCVQRASYHPLESQNLHIWQVIGLCKGRFGPFLKLTLLITERANACNGVR